MTIERLQNRVIAKKSTKKLNRMIETYLINPKEGRKRGKREKQIGQMENK